MPNPITTSSALLPAPTISLIDGIQIVRDDRLPGGTKRRALPTLLTAGTEYVYATPAYGYAQMALAYAARDTGAIATVFVAKRAQLHPRTQAALRAGARIYQVSAGYLTNVQAKARAYAEATGAVLLPFGLDTPDFIAALAAIARALPLAREPAEVWTVAGSGVLTRSLQVAWPNAQFHAIQIGKPPLIGRAQLHLAPEKYEQSAEILPPFPSCNNYDAKAWRFLRSEASPGALFWNVGA